MDQLTCLSSADVGLVVAVSVMEDPMLTVVLPDIVTLETSTSGSVMVMVRVA